MTDETSQNSIFDLLADKWRRRKWLIVVSFLIVFGALTSLVLALPSLYKSSTTILFGQNSIAESYVRESAPNELELRLGIVRQAVMSRSQLQEIIEEFDLYPNLRTELPPQSVINRFRKDITIEQQASTQAQWGQDSNFIVTISYQGWEPELTARIANELAERYETEAKRIRINQATRTTEFIENQYSTAKILFETQESRINEFKNEHMGELPEQQQINLTTLERLNTELRLNGDKQIQLLNNRNDLIFGTGNSVKATGASGLTGTVRLAQLKRDLVDLQARYTDMYPSVIRLQNEIIDLEQEIDSQPKDLSVDTLIQLRRDPMQIDKELAVLKQEETTLRVSMAELVGRIDDTPKIDQQLKSFANDYDTSRNEYLSLQKSLQDARLAESLETQQNQQVRILELAIPPDFPSSPNKQRLMFMGLLAAIAVAASALLVAEQMDYGFHSVSDIRRFTSVPVLANISQIKTLGEKWLQTTRSIVGVIAVITSVILFSYLSFTFGQENQQLVWTISG